MGTDRSDYRTRAMNTLGELHAFCSKHYGLDLRALALFRIGLGTLLLSDLWHRSLHLEAHYTDAGFMPRDRLVSGWSNQLFFSFHNWGGNEVSQIILFLAAGVFAFMLLVGYRTKLAGIMSFLFLASLQGRNYLILQGGDDILRVMLFWSLFVPLSARYSVDAVISAKPARRARRAFSVATNALVLQLFAMYVVSAILKAGPTWHANGNAIHLALHHHAFVTPFGKLVASLPAEVLQYGTWSVWWLELAGPLAFFVPVRTHWFRTALALTYIGFHMGLAVSMELGHFPWVCMVCWLIVLPSWFWDKPVAATLRALSLRPLLLGASKTARRTVETYAKRLGTPRRRPIAVRPRKWSTAFAMLFAVYAGTGTAYAANHGGNVDGQVFDPLLVIRLYANWGMFAPNPPSDSGWFVFVAKQRNGVEVDPWRDGKPVTFDQPDVPSATYKTQRWRKFLDNINNPNHQVVRPYFLRWLCNDYNRRHGGDERITQIEFFHMVQQVAWPNEGYLPLRKNPLGREQCPREPGAHD